MLPKISVSRRCGAMLANVQRYRMLISDELSEELLQLAHELKDVRICHLNSTAFGGGVAELLSRYLPMLQALGVSADWRLIHGQPEFFTVTKAFHNALQGGHYALGEEEQKLYLEVNERSAEALGNDYDVYIVHDPQPAALRHFTGSRHAKWIWRCHIDSSSPDKQVSRFLLPYLEEYDAVVFTMSEFLLPGLRAQRAAFIAPAIDPLATKNMDLSQDLCRRAIADSGVDPGKPLIVQVSRFDPWKDPLGVIEAYRLVKKEVPDVQLALIGAMAGDDPEGGNCSTVWRRKRQVIRACSFLQTWQASAVWKSMCFREAAMSSYRNRCARGLDSSCRRPFGKKGRRCGTGRRDSDAVPGRVRGKPSPEHRILCRTHRPSVAPSR